jgi:hypothetical protein
MGLLDESAGALGLKDEHDLLKKSNQVFVSTSNGNLMGDKEMASDNDLATSDDLIVGLAKGLQKSIANYEEWLKDSTRREAAGKRKLEKNDACGVGDQMPGPDISKDEFGDFEDAPGGCPGCGGDKISHVGEHAGRTHFICHGCAMSYSTPRQENAAAAANGPGPDPMAKEEMVPQAGHPNSKPDPKSVLPDDKKEKEVFGSELDAGSGGPVKKGKKLAKAVAPQAAAPTLTAIIRPKTPKLPGLTPPKGAPPTLTGIIARHAVKAPQGSATFVKKPSAPAAQPQASAPISGQEKRAAGIGLIGNFLSRWKGTGEKGWVDARGAGPATPARAAATAATRMALAEKKDIKKEALAPNDPKRKTGLPSMAGATSIAHDPTKPHAPAKPVAKCGDVSTGKDVAKAAGTGIPAAPKAPKPAAAASTAAKPVTGPAKPKAPPGSAPAQKKEKSAHVLPDGSGFMTGTVGASKKSKG